MLTNGVAEKKEEEVKFAKFEQWCQDQTRVRVCRKTTCNIFASMQCCGMCPVNITLPCWRQHQHHCSVQAYFFASCEEYGRSFVESCGQQAWS
eukprot:79725-Amphidinium_carterae.1